MLTQKKLVCQILKKNTEAKNQNVDDSVPFSYNELLGIYFDGYYNFSGAKRKSMDTKYDTVNLMLDIYDYMIIQYDFKRG